MIFFLQTIIYFVRTIAKHTFIHSSWNRLENLSRPDSLTTFLRSLLADVLQEFRVPSRAVLHHAALYLHHNSLHDGPLQIHRQSLLDIPGSQ